MQPCAAGLRIAFVRFCRLENVKAGDTVVITDAQALAPTLMKEPNIGCGRESLAALVNQRHETAEMQERATHRCSAIGSYQMANAVGSPPPRDGISAGYIE